MYESHDAVLTCLRANESAFQREELPSLYDDQSR